MSPELMRDKIREVIGILLESEFYLELPLEERSSLIKSIINQT